MFDAKGDLISTTVKAASTKNIPLAAQKERISKKTTKNGPIDA